MGREPKTFCSGRKSEQSFPSALARCHLKSHHCPSVACVVCDTPIYVSYVLVCVCVSQDIGCQFEIVFVGWCKANTQTQSVRLTNERRKDEICNDRKTTRRKKTICKSNHHDLSFVSILQNFLDRMQSMPGIGDNENISHLSLTEAYRIDFVKPILSRLHYTAWHCLTLCSPRRPPHIERIAKLLREWWTTSDERCRKHSSMM